MTHRFVFTYGVCLLWLVGCNAGVDDALTSAGAIAGLAAPEATSGTVSEPPSRPLTGGSGGVEVQTSRAGQPSTSAGYPSAGEPVGKAGGQPGGMNGLNAGQPMAGQPELGGMGIGGASSVPHGGQHGIAGQPSHGGQPTAGVQNGGHPIGGGPLPGGDGPMGGGMPPQPMPHTCGGVYRSHVEPIEIADDQWEANIRLGPASKARGDCGGFGPETVVRWSVPRDGRYTVTTLNGTQLNTVLYVRAACDSNAPQLGCNADINTPFDGEVVTQSALSIDAVQDDEWFIFVDTDDVTPQAPITVRMIRADNDRPHRHGKSGE